VKIDDLVDPDVLVVMKVRLHALAVDAKVLDQPTENQEDEQNKEDRLSQFTYGVADG
jgi:hypothetical protein